jgi:hypothetical protein
MPLLEALVAAKFLGRPAHGVYARLSDGVAYPPPRMVKAHTDSGVPHRKKEAL